MSVLYLDASAWVKRYLEEPGTERIQHLFEGMTRLASTGLGYVEVVAALARQQVARKMEKQELDQLQLDLRSDWRNFMDLPVSQVVLDRAADLAQRYRLRGADAVHLAAALGLQDALSDLDEQMVFITSDQELLAAARSVGLEVENPVFV